MINRVTNATASSRSHPIASAWSSANPEIKQRLWSRIWILKFRSMQVSYIALSIWHCLESSEDKTSIEEIPRSSKPESGGGPGLLIGEGSSQSTMASTSPWQVFPCYLKHWLNVSLSEPASKQHPLWFLLCSLGCQWVPWASGPVLSSCPDFPLGRTMGWNCEDEKSPLLPYIALSQNILSLQQKGNYNNGFSCQWDRESFKKTFYVL